MYVILAFLLFLIVFFNSIKNTVFDISLVRNSFTGLILIKDLFLFVLVGVLLFEFYGWENFTTFYLKDDLVSKVSLIILYSLIILFLSIGFISKTIFPSYLMLQFNKEESLFFRSLILSLFLFLLILMTFFSLIGLKHSFLTALLGGGDLLATRLANRHSGIPTVFISLYYFLTIFFSVVSGFYYNRLSKSYGLFLFISILFFSSFFGGKAPIINSIIIFFISNYNSKYSLRLNFKFLLKILILCSIFIFLLYLVVGVQFEGLTGKEFSEFIVNRIGIGQIHGVYEQFSLQLMDSNYIFHAIPFANYFVEYTPYNKDLMMHTWGYNLLYKDETGVMNSLFIGEALAIGGMTLVYISPLIVAFNFCIIVVFLIKILNKFFLINRGEAQKIAALITVSYISFTADIAGLLLFKSFIMVIVFCIPIIFVFLLIRLVKTRL